jgi:hypothetical protein
MGVDRLKTSIKCAASVGDVWMDVLRARTTRMWCCSRETVGARYKGTPNGGSRVRSFFSAVCIEVLQTPLRRRPEIQRSETSGGQS